MSVETGPTALRLDRDNRTYYFCCPECRRSFAAPAEARRRLGRRLAVAWPLAIVTAALAWGPPVPRAAEIAAVLAGVVQVYAGGGFYLGAADAIRRRAGNMDLLVAVGSTTAYLYSLAVVLAPGRLPGGTYFDASALIITVILTGNYLEILARRRATSAVRRLAEFLPGSAVVLDGPVARTVASSDLRVGQRVRVGVGDLLPVDGVVRAGASAVEEALLTGEAVPVRKMPGDAVLAGSRNLEGPLEVEATRVGPDAFVAQVGSLLEEAELSRVPLQRQADRLAAVFVPFVLCLALGASALWLVLSGGAVPIAVLVFVTVVVTACPCAFGLATPAALLVGTGTAAEAGVLFRGGDSVERAARVDTVLFDKTGTLTASEPELDDIVAVPPATAERVLAWAAGLELGVRHPLASAVVARAASEQVTPADVSGVRVVPGAGVRGEVGGEPLALVRGDALGSPIALRPELRSWVATTEERGESWSLLIRGNDPIGGISFRNRTAPGAAEALATLKRDGLGIAMVTGDNVRAARHTARSLGLSEVFAGVAPDGKVAIVRQLQREGHRVAFVGDGINDAPALAASDLGIAVGTGTEVARETGQVLLVRPGLDGVPQALRTGRETVRRVRRNLAWAIGYNAVLLPVAAGALVPWLGLGIYAYLPVLGAVAMGLSSTTVVLNSLSLRWTLRSGGPRAGVPHAGVVKSPRPAT